MSSGGGGNGSDPFELDPFAGDEYDPTVAFSYVSSQEAAKLAEEAADCFDAALFKYSDRTNTTSRSALRSSAELLQALQEKRYEVEDAHQRAVSLLTEGRRESPEFHQAVSDSMEAFEAVRQLHERVVHAVAHAAAQDPDRTAGPPAPLPTPIDPSSARAKILTDMRRWVTSHRGDGTGSVLITRTTPGAGKTHAMMDVAYDEHMAGQKVIFAARTKQMVVPPDGETYKRLLKTSPLGRLRLHVLTGRDETNCYKPETVEAVMAQGYAPGPTVCSKCEHYPANHHLFGMPMCDYYQVRIAAHRDSQAAKRGWNKQFPMILTTHASVIAAMQVQGGRWGDALKGPDLIMFDEDPTDAMEVDIILDEEQCHFVSQTRDTHAAGLISQVLTKGIEIGKRERATLAANGFRPDKSMPANSDEVHTHYDSSYTGDRFHNALRQATNDVRLTTKIPPLTQLLRDVSHGGGFHADTGSLLSVTSTSDINAMDVPPKGLLSVAHAAATEIQHSYKLRSILYEKIHGTMPPMQSTVDIVDILRQHTEVDPLSYIARLECLPEDPDKGRDHDVWRYVVREFRPLANTSATIVVGDAYAQVDHYTQLFRRPVDSLSVVVQLNEDACITRILDSRANITELRNGELQRVLAIAESYLASEAQPGDRVLIYGHNELRKDVEPFLENVLAPRLELGGWAYEHWWGGRGKDQYNGWEFTLCISDPILSVSGIKHVANARAFRDSTNAKDPDEALLHGARAEMGDFRKGLVASMRSSDKRISLEHDRMNVAELTQAIHRSRPVHNATTILTVGEMELEPELLVQTHSVVPSDYRSARASAAAVKRERKKGATTARVEGTIDAFVTPEEAVAAIRAVVSHFGVYGLWFSHALVTGVSANNGSHYFSGRTVSDRMKGQLVIKGPYEAAPSSAPDTTILAESRHETLKVPGEGRDVGAVVLSSQMGTASATEPAGRMVALPNPRTIVERVWDPPVYWQRLIEKASQPRGIRTAHERVKRELPVAKTAHWPRWAKGLMRGHKKPWIVYDPKLVSVDTALRIYYEIVENQYGPVQGGQIRRPNFVAQVPPSMSALPF